MKRTDREMVARLLDRAILLVAISEDIPTAVTSQLEPSLNALAEALALPDKEQDGQAIEEMFYSAYDLADEIQDIQALLGAVRNFVPFLRSS
ncbi:MAG: hypothetical protein ACE5D3_02115 [Candidatus Binatia bacterium]